MTKQLTDDYSDDAEFDVLYSRIDAKLTAGDFAGVDNELMTVDVEHTRTAMLIGWLTITAAAREVLGMRATLVSRIRDHLERTEPGRVDALLMGLE